MNKKGFVIFDLFIFGEYWVVEIVGFVGYDILLGNYEF